MHSHFFGVVDVVVVALVDVVLVALLDVVVVTEVVVALLEVVGESSFALEKRCA